VIAFLVGGATIFDPEEARLLSALIIGLVVFITWIYIARKSRERFGPFKIKYGPLMMVLLGGMLMLMEPLRYELHDAGVVEIPVFEDI